MKEFMYDEAGFDNRDDYPYGYSPRGERCHSLKCGKKRERASWISALKDGKIFAPLLLRVVVIEIYLKPGYLKV